MKINIGVTDGFILYTKTLQAYWNREGHDFHTLYLFFEECYNTIKEFIYRVA